MKKYFNIRNLLLQLLYFLVCTILTAILFDIIYPGASKQYIWAAGWIEAIIYDSIFYLNNNKNTVK